MERIAVLCLALLAMTKSNGYHAMFAVKTASVIASDQRERDNPWELRIKIM
jgi:hypothetical protein